MDVQVRPLNSVVQRRHPEWTIVLAGAGGEMEVQVLPLKPEVRGRYPTWESQIGECGWVVVMLSGLVRRMQGWWLNLAVQRADGWEMLVVVTLW